MSERRLLRIGRFRADRGRSGIYVESPRHNSIISSLLRMGTEMHVRLWHGPYNGGWVWFTRDNLRRCAVGWERRNHKLWWAIFGFSGLIILQTWPWKRDPRRKLYDITHGIASPNKQD